MLDNEIETFTDSVMFDRTFDEGMALVEETARYLDGKGREEARVLPRKAAMLYAGESMRVTTRLMQAASWLLVQRAVLDNIKLGRHAHLRCNVLDALLYLGRARREEMALRADIEARIIDFLEIDHIRHAPVSALSYGLQKRVELARALAMNPKVLMLDEPVAGMNREETDDMARFILDARSEWGVTVLMVEHDMGMVMDLSDHVVVLNFGQVIADGTPTW